MVPNCLLSLKFREPIPVLDDGHILLVDVMGDEQDIIDAARISYGKGTKRILEDRKLLRYLIRHQHTSPLEMCELKLRVRVPMDTWRQWIRHRTASVNESSTRYSIAIDSQQKTEPTAWRSQAKNSKQGSGEVLPLEIGGPLSGREKWLHEEALDVYKERIEHGVAREQARKDLPLSTYTEAYWKIDLHNLLHFLGLRLAPEAQWEIRQYANAIADIVKVWVPNVWEAFEDYRLDAMFLSRMEVEGLRHIVRGYSSVAEEYGQQPDGDAIVIKEASTASGLTKRELDEFVAKLGVLLREGPVPVGGSA